MRPPPPPRPLSLTLLLLGLSLRQTLSVGKKCACDKDAMQMVMNKKMVHDTFREDTTGSLHCCPDMLLGRHDPGAAITWTFNGEVYSPKWGSTLQVHRYCGDRTLETPAARLTDAGNYTCRVTATDGATRTKPMTLSVEHNVHHREKPLAAQCSGDVLATVGASVHFSCEAYVGSSGSSRIFWYKASPKIAFINNLSNVKETVLKDPGMRGVIKGLLVLSSVQEEHFGVYACEISNAYGAQLLKMSLTEGVPEVHATAMRWKTTVVVVAGLVGLLAAAGLLWWRWGVLLTLHCRRHTPASSGGHQYDVFLVHGDSAHRWVWSVLLPALEDTFGYTCFLPQRDMCGGDQVAEAVHEAILQCRRVVVVVTPCLLTSAWATWATYSGVQAALTSRARILALVHKEHTLKIDSPEKNTFLSVLKVVKKIQVPSECGWEPSEVEDTGTKTSSLRQRQVDTQTPALKLIIPENKADDNGSTTPRSQRLSNMINESNAASRENLEAEKGEKADTRGPVVFTVEGHGLQDPGSPCSITPFILPSCSKNYGSTHHALMCPSIGSCLQLACNGDPEKRFWQTMRLHLGPPSLTRPPRVCV